jgi:hypothetical protein
MRRKTYFLWILLLLGFAAGPAALIADRLELKDGKRIEGIIRKVENGQVTVEVGKQTEVFNILDVTSMNFDTPHLPQATKNLPLEHFLASMETQEMVRHVESVELVTKEIKDLLGQIEKDWGNRGSINAKEAKAWDAAKERFSAPMSRYQETLNELYFHVLGKVDEYNSLAKQAREVYVGVRGPFQTGSHLVPKDMERLPLKKYVPKGWYDTIYYEGYNIGYNDAFEKYGKNPY